ncbi:MAG: dihydropyrimidinase [Elusimicrobia bacterium]|nr:dihydropyrimidinase [Elusimicrobiota bacterium]
MTQRNTKRKDIKPASEARMLIKNGTIFTASDSFAADILIEDGKICQISRGIEPADRDKVINAQGLEIYPGGIDAHTHFALPFMGTISADDFETGTIAAACGGTTTVVDFVIPGKGQKLSEAVSAWHEKADGKAAVDYGFHLALVDVNKEVLADIPGIVKAGISSFKCFMAYKGALMIDDDQLLQVLRAAKEQSALVSVHAENGDMLAHLMKRFAGEKKTGPEYHPLAHPADAEGEAVHRAIVLAEMAKSPLHIVHMSCVEALREVQAARVSGQLVLAETCPQYLLLSDELYRKNGFEAAKWVMSPPLRHVSNHDRLWAGLRDGFIQSVSTDHCSFNFKGQKDMGKDDFLKIPNGIPAVGDRVNLLYTYGVRCGRISRNQFAAAISANAAKIFGLYPEKGTVAVGSDADLVIFDPGKTGEVSVKTSKHNVDYSAFEGFKLEGLPAFVISRGKVASEYNKFTGEKGYGRYLSRKRFDVHGWGFE